MSEITAEYLNKLNQQRLNLIDVVNNIVDVSDRLDNTATLDGVVKRLQTIDNYSLLRNYIEPNTINPESDWAINDVDGRFKVIRDSAFLNHTGLESVLFGKLEILNNSAFKGCSSLRKVKIDGQLTIQGGNNFYGCSSLSSASFPHVNKIHTLSLFTGCKSLKSVTFNRAGKLSMTASAAYRAYGNCDNLQALIFPSKDSLTTIDKENKNEINANSNIYCYVPSSLLESYRADKQWSAVNSVRPIRTLEGYDFEDGRYTNNRDYLINVLGADLADYQLEGVSE